MRDAGKEGCGNEGYWEQERALKEGCRYHSHILVLSM